MYGANGAVYGYLGGSGFGVYGKSSGNTGSLGSATEGVKGTNTMGNYGSLGTATNGVYGYAAAGNYGVRGSNSAGYSGALGYATYGVYTGDKIYAGNGISVGGQCTDSTGTAGCNINDVAEDIYSKDELENGDVVVIDSENNEHVKKSSKPYDTMVAGIISLDPAFHIQTSDTGVPLALAGRVKAKASAENGPIKRGDLLTTSSTPGHLMKCESKEKCFGAMVGKALEPLVDGKGKIIVLVMLG